MDSVAIITIVVIALLTIIIFGLSYIGYRSCIKLYELETNQGLHDGEIQKLYNTKKSKVGIIGNILSYIILAAVAGLFVTGIVYKVNGDNFTINNQTVLVIKSESMSEFYDSRIAEKYNYNADLQFDVGDICIFEKVPEDSNLVKGEVYGYKKGNMIITHRLEDIDDDSYRFRGDANAVPDKIVKRDAILYHYIGNKIPGVGTFILFAQSYFGLWSLFGMLGITIISEIMYHKMSKITKERYKLIDHMPIANQELAHAGGQDDQK